VIINKRIDAGSYAMIAIVTIVAVVGLIVLFSVKLTAGSHAAEGIASEDLVGQAFKGSSGNPGLKRVLIRPFTPADDARIRPLVEVRHEFDGAFSANVPVDVIPRIEQLADVEDVLVYEIKAKPVCGDGLIHPREECGEPGLPGCPEGQTCQDCKCVSPSEESARTCTPSVQKPYGIVMVNGGSGGSAVNVAVLDTGVTTDHLDLDVKLCKDATKRGIRKGCSDGSGHGTHVAGTVAATSGTDALGIFGVAPAANLWAVKVCGNNGLCFTDDMAAGIRYVADQGANIISMSIGGDRQSSLVKDAIDYATAKGVLVVAAAGNDGPANGTIDYPGANVKVIAAGAIDQNENVPSFSSRGINDGDFIIEEREVEFGTPGVAVESTWKDGCYKTISGTSMSTPHVSGLAAKLWQGTAAATRTHLQNLAKNHDLHTAGDDTATGFGLPISP